MPPVWWLTKDGDTDCLALYERHYSGQERNGKRRIAQFVGPGENIVLRTERGDAMFVWRRFLDDSGQQGVNCAVFRNESAHLSSELIRQADAIADFCWPDRRHYTFVNQEKIRSSNPGFCFLDVTSAMYFLVWHCGLSIAGAESLLVDNRTAITPLAEAGRIGWKNCEKVLLKFIKRTQHKRVKR